MANCKLIQGNCLFELPLIPSQSIDCVVTSPPYWALRDYGVAGQLGLEATIHEYIANLCNIFDEVKRVLKDEGTLWVNLGDTYGGSGKGAGGGKKKSTKESWTFPVKPKTEGDIAKCLCCIPDRFKIEMINRGWICRNEIIWHKKNCMPASAKDRFTVDYEKIFFFVKQKKYFFKTQLEAYTTPMNRWGGDKLNPHGESTWDNGTGQTTYRARNMRPNTQGRNKRCVWAVNTRPFKDAHFATFTEKLIEPILDAGCPVGGVVMDIFSGAGTTGVVAMEQNKNYIGIELNPVYNKIAEKRIAEKHISVRQIDFFEID